MRLTSLDSVQLNPPTIRVRKLGRPDVLTLSLRDFDASIYERVDDRVDDPDNDQQRREHAADQGARKPSCGEDYR